MLLQILNNPSNNLPFKACHKPQLTALRNKTSGMKRLVTEKGMFVPAPYVSWTQSMEEGFGAADGVEFTPWKQTAGSPENTLLETEKHRPFVTTNVLGG